MPPMTTLRWAASGHRADAGAEELKMHAVAETAGAEHTGPRRHRLSCLHSGSPCGTASHHAPQGDSCYPWLSGGWAADTGIVPVTVYGV